MKMKFEQLNLKPELARAVAEAGYAETFPIQERAIPPALEGKDIIGRAQSGSGKTATFLIPILQKIQPKGLQALILAPTRELAIQITEEAEKLGKHLHVKALTVYGGRSIDDQARRIPGAQIIVGTPGRIIDHIRRGNLKLNTVRMLVLDEADRMLDMGFIEDTEWIIRQTSRDRQTLLYSATMPDEIKRIVSQHMRSPVVIELNVERPAVDTVKQIIWIVRENERLAALKYALDTIKPPIAIIFCATKRGADRLMRELVRNYAVDVIHGDLSQAQRERVLENFRTGAVNILIATDVAARGIDIEDISHVFNFELPNDVETYIHRIGRSGRAGKSGIAISLVTDAEATELGKIDFTLKVRSEKLRFEHGKLLPVHPEEFGSHRAIIPVWTRRERGRRRPPSRPISQSGRGPQRGFGGRRRFGGGRRFGRR
jgi:ATP-dependent RNA helicase DeaD